MLTSLSIHQFALIEHMELDFSKGMTVITGETGAGKSILLGALGLTLGQRAEAGAVRQGQDKADVAATFTVNAPALDWLKQHDLPAEDDNVILRRVISAEGRSRGYVNGRPVSASDLRDLGQHLIGIHSQHAHQRLLEKEAAREILDAYAGLTPLSTGVRQGFSAWKKEEKRLQTLRESSSELLAQRQLLEYQVSELRELDLKEDELNELEMEQKRLSGAENTLLCGQSAMIVCNGGDSGDDAASQMIHRALQEVDNIDDTHPLLDEVRDMLNQAQIQLDEAASSLQRYLDNIDMNPHRLQQVDTRLSELYSMARKHQIRPESLYAHWQEQEAALAAMSLSDDDLESLEAEVAELKSRCMKDALQLSAKRQKAANKLSEAVSAHFDSLGLGKAIFKTRCDQLSEKELSPHGLNFVGFEVQTNPGMPAGPLAKVASGGELSRISLALQVVTAATSHTPCLIFDEVDVGVGGGTAERVGRLMRELGGKAQIMCVTHQPQVAAQAHNHFQVSKVSGDSATHTNIRILSDVQRQEELARMLGGVEITQQTLAHAGEMLTLAKN
ncbi:DNA repair protein RecN [Thalassolituus maritimus]|uniref:DNA repair protein RecN n=1 Tax=Thalassolituus maritimus TaxID=484498 RepID=A0ABP9ZVZ8_9GAMM